MAQQFSGYDGYAFGVSGVTGIVAANQSANSEIFQFRWVVAGTDAKRARILGVTISADDDGTAFAAGTSIFDMVIARAWTAAGTGGGTLTLTGNNNKLRTSQNPTYFNTGGGEIRVATTAALGAGTKTLDANPVSAVIGGTQAVAGIQLIQPNSALWQDAVTPYGQPIILAHQEGFVVRATVPATGTWRAAVNVFWAEVD